MSIVGREDCVHEWGPYKCIECGRSLVFDLQERLSATNKQLQQTQGALVLTFEALERLHGSAVIDMGAGNLFHIDDDDMAVAVHALEVAAREPCISDRALLGDE